MEARNPSRTAFMTAFLRGYHTLHDSPKIINDSLALDLVPAEVREALEKHLAQSSAQMAPDQTAECMDPETALQSGIRTMAGPILARARYVEDRLEEAVRQGVSQYVILGAGFETFAYRRLDLMDRLQVFEIDLPATQEIKRRLLARIGLSTLSAELAGVGLHLIDNLKPSDIQQRYLRGCSGGDSTSKHEHLACARV